MSNKFRPGSTSAIFWGGISVSQQAVAVRLKTEHCRLSEALAGRSSQLCWGMSPPFPSSRSLPQTLEHPTSPTLPSALPNSTHLCSTSAPALDFPLASLCCLQFCLKECNMLPRRARVWAGKTRPPNVFFFCA